MKYAAIIAEFNPFHSGHAYLLKKVRDAFPDRGIVVIMSGNFTQRGDHAVLEKHVRAKHAVENGADAVFELPFPFCSANSQHFAEEAIKVIRYLNVADVIAFGSECGDIRTLDRLETQTREDGALAASIKEYAKTLSYPAAMEKALIENGTSESDAAAAFMPNNALAIQYIRAAKKYAPELTPFTVKRQGAGYNDVKDGDSFPSALAVREQLFDGRVSKNLPFCTQTDLEKALEGYDYNKASDLLLGMLKAKILQLSTVDRISGICDCDRPLATAFLKNVTTAKTLDELYFSIKNKRYTMARIKRVSLYILFDVTKTAYNAALNAPPILNLLAVRNGQTLKEMSAAASLPICSRRTHLTTAARENACSLSGIDLQTEIVYSALFGTEFSTNCIFLDKNK